MRLTSYNMAVKILHAKGCFADMVERMWAYMEEGDTENAQCVREKALGLYALLETVGRWKPTIVDGYITEAIIDLLPVTHPPAFMVGEITVGGLAVSNGFVAYDGTAGAVVDGTVCSFNRFISLNDDLISVTYRKVGPTSLSGMVISAALFTAFTSTNSGGTSGSPSSISISNNQPFSGAQPHCLTDAQILSIIGKIDELCGCNC